MAASSLEQLIVQARRRFVLSLAADQGSAALAAALAGAILLLITGTQVLDWWVPASLFAGALLFGLWRIRRRIPSHYRTAQQIDQRLGLDDALSTAWHFRDTDLDVFSTQVKELQRARAERTAALVDPVAAAPLRWPMALRTCGILAAVAAGLFLVRYGTQQSLDLTRPLVAFEIDPFGGSAGAQQAANRPRRPEAMEEFLKTVSVQPPETKEQGLDPAPDSALGVVDVPDVNNENAESAAKTGEKGPGTTDQQESGESGEQGDGASSGDPKSAENNPANPNDPQQKGQPPNKGQSPQSNDSMLDKMKDAFSNLMNKLNVQQKQGEGGREQQAAQNQKGGPPPANARQQPSKQSMQAKGQQSGEQQQSSNQQGDQDSQESDPSQAAQGKPGDKNSSQAANQENKSGMGKQDGDKDVKMAEQMAAMGKLSEIIGKRNEKLQGEVMLEVNSSKQTLRTQYSQRNAKHAEAGAEIHRDEVPLLYQSYVQQYFDEVRKPAASRPAEPKR